MAQIVIHFEFPNTTEEQYNAVWDDLRKAGHSNPKGLIFHVAARKADGGLFVTDVWESEEAFREFGEILFPIIEKHNVPKAQPTIMPAYNVYESEQAKMAK
jgi:heme-degrading monooxygenase HmoA